MTKTKYPDRTLEKALRALGGRVQCMWQLNGPPRTEILWIECLLVERNLVLVQTFKDGGWRAFVESDDENSVDYTIGAVARRTGVKTSPWTADDVEKINALS